MVVDMHAHLDLGTDWVVERMLERRLVDIVALSSLCGGAFPTVRELEEGNDHVLRWMERFPGRVVGLAYVNPRLGEPGLRELRRSLAAGMRGVKLWISVLADDSRVDPYVELAQEAGAIVLAHAWVKTTGNLPFESRPEHVANLARRFPRLVVQLAHFGGEWETGVRVAKDVPNMVVDISGTLADSGSVEALVRAVGAGRVLFGTDNTDFHYCLGKVMGAQLSEAQRQLILCGNACQLLGLTSSP